MKIRPEKSFACRIIMIVKIMEIITNANNVLARHELCNASIIYYHNVLYVLRRIITYGFFLSVDRYSTFYHGRNIELSIVSRSTAIFTDRLRAI